jgi:hypothetical protein
VSNKNIMKATARPARRDWRRLDDMIAAQGHAAVVSDPTRNCSRPAT